MKTADTNKHTHIHTDIKFGLGVAERQGGCAYFTCFTFRSRLQVLA